MAETEEEEREEKRNTNNVNMNNFCHSPVTTNKQGKIANIPNERQISSKNLAETKKRIQRVDV